MVVLTDEKESQVWVDEGREFRSVIECGKKEKRYAFECATGLKSFEDRKFPQIIDCGMPLKCNVKK